VAGSHIASVETGPMHLLFALTGQSEDIARIAVEEREGW